jgi:hypothetical protein
MATPAPSVPNIEPELTAPIDLCDARGNLNPPAVGFSRRPVHRCNLGGHAFRKKRWSYWAVTNGRYVLSATIADVDYLGLGSVYFIDLEKSVMMERTVTWPFRAAPLSERVHDYSRFEDKRLLVELDDNGELAGIRAHAVSFGGKPLEVDIAITRPAGHETLNVVIPWSHDRFQFTSKQNTLPASGTVRIGDEEFTFGAKDSFAVLDYGRGIWKYNTFWNWGAGSGVCNGRTVGLNLGGGWTDGTGMTENGVCIDGRLHKVHEDLRWEYDTDDFMKPWRVLSDRVDLALEPIFERVTRTNLWVLRTEVHQVFGHFRGTVVDDDGNRVAADGILGWVEQQDARW